jgi:hypothetical protein
MAVPVAGKQVSMTSAGVLSDAFERIREAAAASVDGLALDQLTYRVDPEANTIGWLVWHLTRVQDDHLAGAFGGEQVWTRNGWADRFGLPLDIADIGYGHSSEQVAAVRAPADLLTGYLDAVHASTLAHLRELQDDDLQRVVDPSYDPPVTLGVRLVSVVTDDLQHAGQAAFLRGLVERAGRAVEGR